MDKAPNPGSDALFAPTRWTVVLRARGDTPEAKAALASLCEAYWQPVFRFLRSGGRNEDSSRELTQEFFARLLKGDRLAGVDPGRGRFRSFLLGAVKHFLADVHDYECRQKRGGGTSPEPLATGREGETTATLQVPDLAAMPTDEVFDRDWALTIIDRALTTLEDEMKAEGKSDQFEVLKPWLMGESPGLSQAEAAQKAGLSEGALKVAIHRLRRRFRDFVKCEIAHTVGDATAVQEELKYLVDVLART